MRASAHKRSRKWTKWKQELAINCRKQLAKDISKYVCILTSIHYCNLACRSFSINRCPWNYPWTWYSILRYFIRQDAVSMRITINTPKQRTLIQLESASAEWKRIICSSYCITKIHNSFCKYMGIVIVILSLQDIARTILSHHYKLN